MSLAFSVIMRVHRRPERLRKSLESIYVQQYDNVQLFTCLDDIKNDLQSLRILAEYEKKGLNISCMTVKPIGFPACNLFVNELIKQASEDSWVHILDDDDAYSIPDFFSKAAAIVKTNNPEIIISKYLLKKYRGKNDLLIPQPAYFNKKLIKLGAIGGACYLMKKKLALSAIWPPRRGGDFHGLMCVYNNVPKEKIFWWSEQTVETISTQSQGKADI